jgi:hypothetical protein
MLPLTFTGLFRVDNRAELDLKLSPLKIAIGFSDDKPKKFVEIINLQKIFRILMKQNL